MPSILPIISNTPLISVVMAVKNGGHLIKESILSILDQTYSNFELIIINDGSTDDTDLTLQKFAQLDSRIRFYSQKNQGLSCSLNRALSLASGELIARQDHDDFSKSNRLEKQVLFFKENPDCGLLGTAAEIWDINGPTGRFHDHPTTTKALKFNLIFNNPFVHSSIVFHRKILDKVGFYSEDPKRQPPEDYEFISRVARAYNVFNLPDRLVAYREIPGSISSELRPMNSKNNVDSQFLRNLAIISAENLAFSNHLTGPDNQCISFGQLQHGNLLRDLNDIDFRYIRNLIMASIGDLKGLNPKEYGICKDLIVQFYSKYFSLKNLSFRNAVIFTFSGKLEFKFAINYLLRKIKALGNV